MKYPFASAKVEKAFDLEDAEARRGLLALRALIFDIAAELPAVGRIEEALRWGQPAYLTPDSKSGSTLRLGVPKGARFGVFVHCQSELIPEYLKTFPAWDRVEGTRAVLFDHPSEVEPLRHGWLIKRALTYHIREPLDG
ncbi:hypothetical protein A9Q94_18555 [Rhodobacterales bacterium 56_14_T64]|nr:hypothetical protein A9Q94_18555 [Rhodobacterales bacterium 56_14_T64]